MEKPLWSDSYQENGHPGETDVVEGDGPVEGVLVARLAVRVVQVPVDAVGLVVQSRLHGCVALAVALFVRGQVVALVHARAVGHRADVVLLTVGLLEVHLGQVVAVKKKERK